MPRRLFDTLSVVYETCGVALRSPGVRRCWLLLLVCHSINTGVFLLCLDWSHTIDWYSFRLLSPSGDPERDLSVLFFENYPFLFLYPVLYVLINALISAAVISRIASGPDDDEDNAAPRALQNTSGVLVWTVLDHGVGFVLCLIEQKLHNLFVIKWLAPLLNVAWGAATYLVMPVLVLENEHPIDAISRSVQLFKKTWGANSVSMFAFFLFSWWVDIAFSIFLAIIVLATMNHWINIPTGLVILVFAIVLTDVSLGLLKTIFKTALYFFAIGKHSRQMGYSTHTLEHAFAPKT